MAGRDFSSDMYRFGFNGKEKDGELKGANNTYDYGFRMYDPRLGRFFTVDPLAKDYPFYSPYDFAGNKPIVAIDIEGLEEYVVIFYYIRGRNGENHIYKVDYKHIEPLQRIDPTAGKVYQINKTYNSEAEAKSYSRNVFREGDFTRNFFSQHQDKIKDISAHSSYASITKDFRNSTSKTGSLYYKVDFRVKYAADEGNTVDEVKAKIESSDNTANFDRLAAVLNKDPDAIINITGSASKIPTNIDRSQPNTTEENNQQLAQQRADAAKQSLIEYYLANYGANLDPNRIITTTAVAGAANVSSEEGNPNQYVHFESSRK